MAIQMDPIDHMNTPSWGSKAARVAYRQQQGDLVSQGGIRDALAIESKALRRLFGSKYNQAILQALKYGKAAGYLNKR